MLTSLLYLVEIVKTYRCFQQVAHNRRRKILQMHLVVQGAQTQLRSRVKDLLSEVVEPSASATEIAAIEKVNRMLEVDPLDPAHLFYEELRRIGLALREVQPKELDEKILDALIPALDLISSVSLRHQDQTTKREDGITHFDV